jgi:predicted dehydrogenase
MLIDAVKAGKDVYCEKPLTLTIDEGKEIRKAVQASGRIVQVGSWQRSDHRFRTAVEMVRAGRIGKLEKVDVVLGKNQVGGPFAKQPVPPGLDWNLWQGQTPDVAYVPERCHFNFRWWQAYSGGDLTDWGAHHVDIARWAIGADPDRIDGQAEYPQTRDGYDVPLTYSVRYRFTNGVEMTVGDSGRNGIMFTGSEGRIFVNRENLSGKPVEDLASNPLPAGALDQAYTGRPLTDHFRNFFESARDRVEPISDVFSHHRALSTCHLAGIAARLNRAITWDPNLETIPNDPQAQSFLARDYRKGFEIEQS